MSPRRPALRYHGGKWLLARWVIAHFPKHQVYVEPFGGAASVLLQKPRSYAEVYNDLDSGVVNLFRVMRDDVMAARLKAALEITPFAREEFNAAYDATPDPVETARRMIVRSFMGFGSASGNPAHITGFRANSNRSGSTPAHDWQNYPENIPLITDRMRGVIIENRPALDVMAQHDGPDTLHYCDPPYLPETRDKTRRGIRHTYVHEMTVDEHAAMLEAIKALDGMVVLSGYPAPLYDDALAGWKRIEREALADGARKRIEVLWINPRAAHALGGDLFMKKWGGGKWLKTLRRWF